MRHTAAVVPVVLRELIPFLFVVQLTSTIKIKLTHQLPNRVFFDREYRNHVINTKWGRSKHPSATKLRNACNSMLPETELAWRMFERRGLEPLSTQDPVAWCGIGTKVDVVVLDTKTGRRRVVEMKRSAHTREKE